MTSMRLRQWCSVSAVIGAALTFIACGADSTMPDTPPTGAVTATQVNATMMTKDVGSINNVVKDALTEVSDALAVLVNPTDIVQTKMAIIKFLVNSGEPVVIENIGPNQTLSACTDLAATKFSTMAKAMDASPIGMKGCLVYNKSAAVTDLNDPLEISTHSLPASFRSVARETGVVYELLNDIQNGRSYAMAGVSDYLFSLLGHAVYFDSDEGVVTPITISPVQMTGIFSTFLGLPGADTSGVENKIVRNADLRNYRVHFGFNPSGGWEINVAAAPQNLPSACIDSYPVSGCPVAPARFDFDGATLTPNANGPYILKMVYWNGGFLDLAYVIRFDTGEPYRDIFYQAVHTPVVASNYSVIDYPNPAYQADLDPLSDGQGHSVPFANAAWRAAFPTMSLVKNAYLFPAPEVAARQFALLQQNPNLTKIPALQAYAITKLMTRGMAAFRAGSVYGIFGDHDKAMVDWENITALWLRERGTADPFVMNTGNLKIQNGKLTFLGDNNVCTDDQRHNVRCSISSEGLKLKQSGKSVEGGTRFDITDGNITVTSPVLGDHSKNYTPAYLLVAPDGRSAQLIGDIKLSFSFNYFNIPGYVTSGSKLQSNYTMTLYPKDSSHHGDSHDDSHGESSHH